MEVVLAFHQLCRLILENDLWHWRPSERHGLGAFSELFIERTTCLERKSFVLADMALAACAVGRMAVGPLQST